MSHSIIAQVLASYLLTFAFAIRPAFEDDSELCPFTNRLTINDLPAEMTPKISGMKYFRRLNESKEEVTMDKAKSLCRMYNLEAAEILDQDDYNEVISIVKETGWDFWINVKGKYSPQYGNYHFDFTLADGYTKIGFHDFGPQGISSNNIRIFELFKEGCVAVEPNNVHPSGVSWSKNVCTNPRNILCQYQKSCYRRSEYMKDLTRPIKRLIPIPTLPQPEESGFAISTHQATWPFAKQVCEDAEMQLLWFESNVEQDELRKLLNLFIANKVQYQGKSFWTGGRFSPGSSDRKSEIYSRLYWWRNNVAYEVFNWDLSSARSGQPENSGGFLKTWGKDREATHLDKNEPYDEGLQGVERCVDTNFLLESQLYYTSKCDKSLRYFICKQPEVVKQTLNHLGSSQQPSFMDYCDGNEYRQTKGKDCSGEVIFAGEKKPDCTCYSGVHALMADIRCKPRLLVGTGCIKLKAKSSVHWKILSSEIISDNKPWIIVVHNSDGRYEMFNWFHANIHESAKRQVLGSSTFFYAGFDLYRDEKKDDLCFIMNTEISNSTQFYEYSVPELPSVSMRHYYDNENCGTRKVPLEEIIVHEVHFDKNDCKLETCSRQEANSNVPVLIDIRSVSPQQCNDGTNTCDDIHDIVDEEGQAKKAAAGKIEGDIEDVNDNLNRQLLIHAIEMAFPYFNGPGDSAQSGPRNTWLIMDKLFELAKQTCGKMVNQNFLSRVLKYFKIAHYGENYEYGEYFTDAETKEILTMLDFCGERAYALREMDVEMDTCTGKASKITLENKTREIISRTTDDTGYQAVFHHHIIEATWDVIDLWNAVCINEFKPSYLLFHHMERGLEILFTGKLRKLWHFPNVTEEYYQKLLGPDEGIQLLNLDQCVVAAYRGNMRTNRMNRPLKGRNTVVGQMIRNRLEESKLKEDGIVSTNNNMHSRSRLSTACIRGTGVRCHKKQNQLKRAIPLALY